MNTVNNSLNFQIKKILFVTLITFFLVGCQTIRELESELLKQPNPNSYNPNGEHAELAVDAITAGSNLKRYVLIPHESLSSSNLQYKQFEKQINYSLSKAGLTKDDKNAEIGIIFYYGIGSPKTTTKTFAIPIFGQTGVSSVLTTGQVYGSNYSQTTQITPRTGVVGYSEGSTTTVTFDRYLTLMAYDLLQTKKNKKLVEIWQLNIISTGPSDDLRRAMPYMTVASQNYINTDTKQKLYIEVHDSDASFVEMQNLK